MNIAQLLDYGPRLKANVISERSGEKSGKRYSPKMIERYKSKSQDGYVWSTLLSPSENTEVGTISKNLKEMLRDGILIECGKYMESRASNKPVLYKWA